MPSALKPLVQTISRTMQQDTLFNYKGCIGQPYLRLQATVAFLSIRANGPVIYPAQPEGLGVDQHNIQIKG